MLSPIQPKIKRQPPMDILTLHSQIFEAVKRMREESEQIKSTAEKVSNDLEESKKVYDQFKSDVENVAKIVEIIDERISQIPKGDPGEPGKQGEPGRPGKDAVAPVIDYNKIIKEVLTAIPRPKDGLPGKDAVAPTIEEILDEVKKSITIDHVKGLKNEMASYRNQLAGKVYGKDTSIRGGGDTVVAGSGVSIVYSNGVKTISATGGGTIVTPTGTVDSSNVTFTVASQPVFIVSDGIIYYEGYGYSYLGGTITMDIPPSQYIRAHI